MSGYMHLEPMSKLLKVKVGEPQKFCNDLCRVLKKKFPGIKPEVHQDDLLDGTQSYKVVVPINGKFSSVSHSETISFLRDEVGIRKVMLVDGNKALSVSYQREYSKIDFSDEVSTSDEKEYRMFRELTTHDQLYQFKLALKAEGIYLKSVAAPRSTNGGIPYCYFYFDDKKNADAGRRFVEQLGHDPIGEDPLRFKIAVNIPAMSQDVIPPSLPPSEKDVSPKSQIQVAMETIKEYGNRMELFFDKVLPIINNPEGRTFYWKGKAEDVSEGIKTFCKLGYVVDPGRHPQVMKFRSLFPSEPAQDEKAVSGHKSVQTSNGPTAEGVKPETSPTPAAHQSDTRSVPLQSMEIRGRRVTLSMTLNNEDFLVLLRNTNDDELVEEIRRRGNSFLARLLQELTFRGE